VAVARHAGEQRLLVGECPPQRGEGIVETVAVLGLGAEVRAPFADLNGLHHEHEQRTRGHRKANGGNPTEAGADRARTGEAPNRRHYRQEHRRRVERDRHCAGTARAEMTMAAEEPQREGEARQ
jgi:hypothetical protein